MGNQDRRRVHREPVHTSAAAYEIWTGAICPGNPATAQFPVWRRIGSLTPEDLDRWWGVDESVDVDRLSSEVAELIEANALPFLDRFPTEADLLAEYRVGRPPSGPERNPLLIQAILEWRAGESAKAQRLLEQALAESRVVGFHPTIHLIAQRMQLALGEPLAAASGESLS